MILLLFTFGAFAIIYAPIVKCNHYRGTVLTSDWNTLGTFLNFKAQVYYKRTGTSYVYCDDSYTVKNKCQKN